MDQYVIAFQDVDYNGVGVEEGVSEMVLDGVCMVKCLSCVYNGFALFIWFVSGNMGIPHVVIREVLHVFEILKH